MISSTAYIKNAKIVPILARICQTRNYVNVINNVRTYFGFHFGGTATSTNQSGMTSDVTPYIRYPVITKDQIKRMATNDTLSLDYLYALYAHHLDSAFIHSLSDLTDPAELNSLLPKRRPVGSPVDTILIKAGDDAMLVSPTVLAVADGVSGWELKGKNCLSALWSRSLVETLSRLLTEYKIAHLPHHLEKRDIDQILDDSFLHTLHLMDVQGLKGLSTLALAMISGDYLQMISIGDLKIYLVRDGKIIKQNEEQMIAGLCPQQIGTQTLDQMPLELASIEKIKVQEDDIIIVCLDGVSDNLYEWEITSYVNEFYGKLDMTKKISRKILQQAKEVAFDDYASTPYSDKLDQLHLNSRAAGGKVDDMTVVVAKVKSLDKKE